MHPLQGQDVIHEIQPNIIPLSPTADNLGKYGEVAVGEYTGTPDISIPLHTIKSGKLEFPINLYYDASGVRVNQEATWVGLGWQLSAIAGITHVSVGGNDQAVNQIEPIEDWEKLINYINPSKIYPTVGHEYVPHNTSCSNSFEDSDKNQTPGNVIRSAINGLGQPDIYSVNCMGMSFKFYKTRPLNRYGGGSVCKIYGDKGNYRIEVIDGMGFKITDGDGVAYTFAAQEGTNYLREINTWYLTEIRRPDGDWLKFTYKNFGLIHALPPASEQELHGANNVIFEEFGAWNRKVFPETLKNLYLTEIESKTERITFKLSANRSDLKGDGARRLDEVVVANKFTDSNKRFLFKYDYFQGEKLSGNYLAPGWADGSSTIAMNEDHLSKRMKLLSITEKATSGQERTHTFTYNEEKPLPWKTSFAVDHWGYYNGENTNKRTFIPPLFSVSLFQKYIRIPNDIDPYSGANRGADPEYMTVGCLQSVTYPTKGKTAFTFEPHTFSNSMVLSAQEENKVAKSGRQHIYIYDLNYPDGTPSAEIYEKEAEAEFALKEETTVDITVNINNKRGEFTFEQMQGTTVYLLKINAETASVSLYKRWDVEHFFDDVYDKVWNEKLTLPAAKYVIKCNVRDDLGFQGYEPLAQAVVVYSSTEANDPVLESHEFSIGGGLRISQIQNLDADGEVISTKQYEYVDEDGTTSGKLMVPLYYAENRKFKYFNNQSFPYCTNSAQPGSPGASRIIKQQVIINRSNSTYSTTTSPIKAAIGYSRVVIKELDKKRVAGNGKIVKTFTNDPPVTLFWGNITLTGSLLNGTHLSETFFRSGNEKVRMISYDYNLQDREKDWINVTIRRIVAGAPLCTYGGDSDSFSSCDEVGEFQIGVFYYENYKKLLKSKTETHYTLQGEVTREVSYEYNLNNYEVSKITTQESDQHSIITKFTYPHDYLGTQNSDGYVAGSMVERNIINPVIEQIRYNDKNELLERRKTAWFFVEHNYIEPVRVEQQLKKGATYTLLNNQKFSDYGNVEQFTASDKIVHSLIWGYDDSYLLAEVENAKRNDVFYTGFEAGDGNSNEGDCHTGYFSRIGGYTKELSGLSGGAYELSYWVKTGNSWIFNTKPVKVTDGSGTYTISISTTEPIDNIRFVPLGARMTTYTHDPLYGVTSITDQNNMTTFYEYDHFGRLKLIRDNERRIRDHFQ
ncbi:hypothetical protein, partial [Fulvivirga kasyanovii]